MKEQICTNSIHEDALRLRREKALCWGTVGVALLLNMLLLGIFSIWPGASLLLNMCVDILAFTLAYSRFSLSVRPLQGKLQLSRQLLGTVPETVLGKVSEMLQTPMTIQGLPCHILRLETESGCREFFLLEPLERIEAGCDLRIIAADGFLLAWEERVDK